MISLITIANITPSSGTMGTSSISAIDASSGFATTLDITLAGTSLSSGDKLTIDSSNEGCWTLTATVETDQNYSLSFRPHSIPFCQELLQLHKLRP